MSDRTFYGVTGFSNSGKTSFSSMLEPLGYEVLEVGDYVKQIAGKYREEGQSMGEAIEELGNDTIAEEMGQIIEEELSEDQDAVISGVRSVETERMLRQNYSAEIISIDAGYETRRGRMLEREGNEDQFTGEELSERDGREIRTGLGYVISGADYHIHNEESLREFAKQSLMKGDPWRYSVSATDSDEIIDQMINQVENDPDEEG